MLTTLFGHPSTWLLLAGMWCAIAIVSAAMFAVIAKVGRGRGRE